MLKINKKALTFDKYLGIQELKAKKGYSKLKLKLQPQYMNYLGITHGGLIATFSDVTLASAIHTVLEKDEVCLTINLDIEFINPAFKGEIFGFGKVVKKGNNFIFVEGHIESKDKKLIAKTHGIWAIKRLKKK